MERDEGERRARKDDEAWHEVEGRWIDREEVSIKRERSWKVDEKSGAVV